MLLKYEDDKASKRKIELENWILNSKPTNVTSPQVLAKSEKIFYVIPMMMLGARPRRSCLLLFSFAFEKIVGYEA